MLAIIYLISAVAGILSYMFGNLRRFKQRMVSLVISILSAIAFCTLMVNRIMYDFPNLDFWPIFAVLSLILWQFACISGDIFYGIDYIIVAGLLSTTLCLLCPVLYPSNNWEKCNIEHRETEIVPIITTINNYSSTEGVYGDGYIIRCIHDISSNKIIYQCYRFENGTKTQSEFPSESTTIHYISNNENPYLKITTSKNCSGYNPDFNQHIFESYERMYDLYVPEGSVFNILSSELY